MGRGIDSRNRVWNWVAKLHRLAARYDNPMPTWFLAPIAGLKLPTLDGLTWFPIKKLTRLSFLNAVVMPLKGHQAAGLVVVQLGHHAHLGQLQAAHCRVQCTSQLEVTQRHLHQLMQNLFGHVTLQEAVVSLLTKQTTKQYKPFYYIETPVFYFSLSFKWIY